MPAGLNNIQKHEGPVEKQKNLQAEQENLAREV